MALESQVLGPVYSMYAICNDHNSISERSGAISELSLIMWVFKKLHYSAGSNTFSKGFQGRSTF